MSPSLVLSRLRLLLLILLLPLAALAEKWTPETLPMVHLQDARRFVCNPDGILSPATVAHNDSILLALKTEMGIESVVVVVKQLEGDDPYEFGMALARKYGIGSKKKNTGFIVILATEDRSYQILTGTGMEGTLPDAICSRIERRVMVPLLKKQAWDEAITATLGSIDGYIRKDPSIAENIDETEDSMDFVLGFAFTLFFSVLFISMLVAFTRNCKCPKCKQARMVTMKRQCIQFKGSRQWYIATTLRCPRCGHEKVEMKKEDNGLNGGGVPPIIMGGGRGGSFGGGSFGGSFGGGMFGGGGAGGRF